jgi:AraC-like DNA-binding protein
MYIFKGTKKPSLFALENLFYSDIFGQLKSSDFLIERKGLKKNLVMYVLSGTLHVEQNGHHILKKDEAILLRLSQDHKYYTDETDICEILWIDFFGNHCEDLLMMIERDTPLPVIFKETRIADLIRKCFKINDLQDHKRELLISEAIYSILMTIAGVVKKTVAPDFINNVSAYADRNIFENIDLNTFSEYFNYSPYHFCRIFNKFFGTTPMRYIRQKKVEMSLLLLSHTNTPISEIAARLGFTDQSHFNKTFKHFQGVSPLEFRKTI